MTNSEEIEEEIDDAIEGQVVSQSTGKTLTHDDFQEIKRMRDDGASPETVVREMGLTGDQDAADDIVQELSSLAPGSMPDYRNFLERMVDDIEEGAAGKVTAEIDAAIAAQTGDEWWKSPTSWVNYGDVNPEDHGGRWVRWDGSGWQIVDTLKIGVDAPEDFGDASDTHVIMEDYFFPDSVFVDGDPENGLTGNMMTIAESLNDERLTINWWQDHPDDLPSGEEPEYAPEFKRRMGYYVADLSFHAGDSETTTTGDFWGHLESKYGITRDESKAVVGQTGSAVDVTRDQSNRVQIRRLKRNAAQNYLVTTIGARGGPNQRFQTDTLNLNGTSPMAFGIQPSTPDTVVEISASKGLIEVEHNAYKVGNDLTLIHIPDESETKTIGPKDVEGRTTEKGEEMMEEANEIIRKTNETSDCEELFRLFEQAADLYENFIDAASRHEVDRHQMGAMTPKAEVGNAWVITKRHLRNNGCITEQEFNLSLGHKINDKLKAGLFDQAQQGVDDVRDLIYST